MPADDRGRVLAFRPRGARRGGPQIRGADPDYVTPVDDLSKYEQAGPFEDDRHRMLINVLAIAVISMLMISGMWLTGKLVEIRDLQDCYLSGRSNCSPIHVPSVQHD